MKINLTKLASRSKTIILITVNWVLRFAGYNVVNSKRLIDFYLYEYGSYEHYRNVQIFHNKRKLNRVWSDKTTLSLICDELKQQFPDRRLTGICHGTRSGFEQNFMSEYAGFDVIGTEISDTYNQFDKTVHWDFHNVDPQWVSRFDFVYSNSLDQAWNPREALTTWLNQLNDGGILVIEHTEAHGPEGASEMDPFGVRPTVMPYVLSEWFGWDVSMKIVQNRNDNYDLDAWLFFVRKNVPFVE